MFYIIPLSYKFTLLPLQRPGFGVLYFFTFGLGGCGYLIDMFRMPHLVSMANKRRLDTSLNNKKNISDAYTLWFPFGLLGKKSVSRIHFNFLSISKHC